MSRLDWASNTVGAVLLLAAGLVLGHPSGLVGRKVSSMIETRRVDREVRSRWGELAAPSQPGADTAAIVEFLDYRCSFCRIFEDTLSAAFPAESRTVLRVRHAPRPGDMRSRRAALAAICAEEQGEFARMHSALLAGSWWESVTESVLADSAHVAEPEKFSECLGSVRAESVLRADSALAAVLGLTGTPAFPLRGHGVFYGVPEVAVLRRWATEK